MKKHKTVKLDAINKKILATLHKNADLSNQELSDAVALSPSACFQRTKALKEAGYFVNFQTEMDLDRLCEHVLAYVEFKLDNNTVNGRAAFEEAINQLPEFMDCVRVSDDIDYISFTCFPDIKALNQACNELSANPKLGIERIKTRVILERAKWCLGYPLEKLKWIE
ncbi:Lrp/AsnC family transcriptional regulator [Paraglaciecola marina]|uniref:Lrp/AsnC family transcriptional regulator n=1 Tax=Paraglaciecola marina TaxID=2500157 RepID=UPI001060C141|nr:Lrp/AsnC family transcriptional regulator [Paraglaciecola marina]